MANPTVIINLEPDWGYTPEISYAFETVIQPTPYFVEQRRPLLPTPIRIQGCRYAFSGNSIQYARNLFLYGLSKLCCVPIYSEPIFSAAVTQGATSITATTDLTYLWNLKNSDWLILLDFVSGQSEMLGISSVSGQVINLSSAIVNSWTASRTIIFPAFAGTISKVKGMDTTDRVGRVDVEFEEQPIGEVSTKVWVGLDEQECQDTSPLIDEISFNTASDADDVWAWGLGTIRHDGAVFGRFLESWSQTDRSCFRFNNIAIPRGVRIRQAYITFSALGGDTSVSVFDIKVNDVDNAVAPVTLANFNALVWATSPVVVWTPPSSGATFVTADISALIQYIIDRPGWVSGNSIQLGFSPNTAHGYLGNGSAGLWVRTFTYGNSPILTVG